jgi:hypothetical protein
VNGYTDDQVKAFREALRKLLEAGKGLEGVELPFPQALALGSALREADAVLKQNGC